MYFLVVTQLPPILGYRNTERSNTSKSVDANFTLTFIFVADFVSSDIVL